MICRGIDHGGKGGSYKGGRNICVQRHPVSRESDTPDTGHGSPFLYIGKLDFAMGREDLTEFTSTPLQGAKAIPDGTALADYFPDHWTP